ncbi:hypothetical protein FHS46_004208 [Variibacter gotjawalensis]|nr:hypothetical protein [Variibacter gotjawalensis]
MMMVAMAVTVAMAVVAMTVPVAMASAVDMHTAGANVHGLPREFSCR